MSDDHGERLVRIETKLDIALKTHEDHEDRLRSIERKVWSVSGAMGLASFALTLLAKKIGLA